MNDSSAGSPAATLLGDEAAALGAVHAGLSAAYGYPGTPSTEILEYLIAESGKGGPAAAGGGPGGGFTARWCTNEKTALEAGLGVSMAGRRAMVTMKHVGLNVAADPFINGALLGIRGGLVIAVADDPGMHSSQNEQDSRFYAAFAMVPCLEPRSQQEAYDMTREAFDISEEFHVPVMLRLATRLSHARAAVTTRPGRGQNGLSKAEDRSQWMLLPVFARKNYAALIEKQRELLDWSQGHPVNRLELSEETRDLAVITAGLGGNYYEENLEDLVRARGGKAPPRLHIGAYPLPAGPIRKLCGGAARVLVIEEGQPFIEERLRGILPQATAVSGRLDGTVIRAGELDPDNVRRSLGLPPRPGLCAAAAPKPPAPPGRPPQLCEAQTVQPGAFDLSRLPQRPPQLCAGCPHGDSYETINRAVAALDGRENHPSVLVNSDIGCYSLGALPPHSAIESIVCMGASVGMARGAAEAGIPYALAVIGDSTFLHSGIPGLIDAVTADSPMTLCILDNSTVAMTGCQKTMIPTERLAALILGLGVKAGHLLELETKRQLVEENAARLKKEIEYPGLSVVIFRRECLEAARKRRSAEAGKKDGAAGA
jgi:indolepyruvate ferredoxin oxidoreductase alpha subunit